MKKTNKRLWHFIHTQAYEKLISLGVAREIARSVLPVGIFTELYFSINNFLKFLTLRLAEDCQKETRDVAEAMYEPDHSLLSYLILGMRCVVV